MRFMVIVKATAESEKEGALPDPQLMAETGKFNEELIKAGVVLAMDGLQPSSKGARVKFSGLGPEARHRRWHLLWQTEVDSERQSAAS